MAGVHGAAAPHVVAALYGRHADWEQENPPPGSAPSGIEAARESASDPLLALSSSAASELLLFSLISSSFSVKFVPV
jgi:hypothetical protein